MTYSINIIIKFKQYSNSNNLALKYVEPSYTSVKQLGKTSRQAYLDKGTRPVERCKRKHATQKQMSKANDTPEDSWNKWCRTGIEFDCGVWR